MEQSISSGELKATYANLIFENNEKKYYLNINFYNYANGFFVYPS